MGVVGGLLGALFNCMNKALAKYRMRHIHPKAKFIRWLRTIHPPNHQLSYIWRQTFTFTFINTTSHISDLLDLWYLRFFYLKKHWHWFPFKHIVPGIDLIALFQNSWEFAGYHGDNSGDICSFRAVGRMPWLIPPHNQKLYGKYLLFPLLLQYLCAFSRLMWSIRNQEQNFSSFSG